MSDFALEQSVAEDEIHQFYMREALQLAREAAAIGEVPVGAVIVHNEQIVGRGKNEVELHKDATMHAEIIALKDAAKKIGDWRMQECVMYVTKEPCAMCSGALVNSRMREVFFAVRDPRCGGCGSSEMNICSFPGMLWQVKCTGGVLEDESLQIIRDFFSEVRREKKINKQSNNN